MKVTRIAIFRTIDLGDSLLLLKEYPASSKFLSFDLLLFNHGEQTSAMVHGFS